MENSNTGFSRNLAGRRVRWQFFQLLAQLKVSCGRLEISNRSSLEFANGAREKVTFRAGQSDWKKDRPAEQLPGRPYRIEFSLNSPPLGTFTLEVSVLTYNPRIPALQVELNGHKGVFYFQPKLSYYLGEQMSVFDPQYSEAALEILLPAAYLSHGGAAGLLA